MKLKYIMASFLIGSCTFISSCKDDFADINTNPTIVSKPDPRYLFTQALANFDGHDYFAWYYDYNNMLRWSQTVASTGGNENLMTTMSNSGKMGSQVYNVMNQVNELTYIVNTTLEGEEQAKYTYLKALCQPLMIYLAMWDTDMYGSMAYTEAYQARYGGTLTPKYDTQAELFDLWEKQLKETVETLANDVTIDGNKVTQQSLGSQDIIYQGDYTKWLKFANSLRLKLAVRLINEDKNRALNIVRDAAKYPIMDGLEDDFFYNKSATDRHRTLVRRLNYNHSFRKRHGYVDQNVQGWKAPGEPWVRYYGLPTEVEAGLADQHPEYVDYFDKAGKLWKVSDKDGNGETTYYPYSPLNQYMFDKKVIIDYPVAPGAPKVQITDLYAWYGLYLSTAEVNLYLAELKLLSQGQDIGFSGSAESYLKKGVEYSMRAYDKLAGLNHIPYYDNTFGQDKFDVTIKLQENEVTRLLNDPILTLDGSTTENLEKVYLQQYIHFIFFPADQYIMMRRSGCPMKESDLYPMLNLNPKVSNYPLPRRFQVTQPTVDDKMGDIKRKAYQDQGYSYGPEPTILNTERVWYDKKAPQFGEGPNLN